MLCMHNKYLCADKKFNSSIFLGARHNSSFKQHLTACLPTFVSSSICVCIYKYILHICKILPVNLETF